MIDATAEPLERERVVGAHADAPTPSKHLITMPDSLNVYSFSHGTDIDGFYKGHCLDGSSETPSPCRLQGFEVGFGSQCRSP